MGLEQLQSYIMGVVLSIIIITSGLMFLSEFRANDTTIDPTNSVNNFNRTLNKADEVTTAVDGMSGSIEDASTTSTGVLGWLNALVGSIFDGLKALFSSFSFISVMATETGEALGVPTIFISLALLIITIIIVFAIWSAITKV